MARFQGDVNAGSDRAAATLLFLVLLTVLLLGAWWLGDRAGFMAFWDGLSQAVPGGR